MKIFKLLKLILPVLFSLFIIWLFWQTKFSAVKFYPVCINFIFLSVFAASCFTKETIIQKIAKVTDGALNEHTAVYTRNLTYIWVLFLFFNFCISFFSLFASDEFWMLYNGFISYFLAGFLFAVEYIVRVLFKRRHNI